MRRARLAALAAAAIALCPISPAVAAEQTTLRSGRLSATVGHDPFGITFADRGTNEVVLRTLGGEPKRFDSGSKYGPLGYSFDLRVPVVNNAYFGYYIAAEAETIWFHARRAVEVERRLGSLRLIAETNDPLGHRLEIVLEKVTGGAIRVSSRIEPGSGPLADLASVSGAAFDGDVNERFFGFGERSNGSEQRQFDVVNWAEEGPFSSGLGEDVLRPLIPSFTFPTGPTTTNLPIPWALSGNGYGLLIDQPHRSRFRLADWSGIWQAEAEAGEFRYIVFAGPEPADALRRYSGWVGRQPDPAPWIFGPWFQPTGEAERFELARRFRRDDVPVTVAQTYTHYLPCGAHVGNEQSQRELTKGYHELGYKITTYFNPHVCTSYEPVYSELAERSLFVENALGEPYILSNPFTADEQVSEFDFTNPEAVAYFQRLLDDAIDAGYDGWMEDFGEYTPTDSRFDNGKSGLEMHNRYPVIYHRASTEHTKRRMGRDAAVFVRSGWHGIQPHARVVWGGDPTEDWSCADGICAAMNQALSTGMSGIAYWGSDIGGFHAVVNPRTGDELNIRWLELGAFSGVMRTQANGYSFRDNRAERSQVWSDAVYPIWRRYSKLRTQLLPYIEAASAKYQRTGMPLSRHMLLVAPDDPRAVDRGDQMMFGDELLVAPVLIEGRRRKELWLPEGEWIDLWRSARWAENPGTLRLGRARVLSGSQRERVPAPLEQTPIFVRAGATIPMLPADLDTLADVGEDKKLVSLAERRRRLRLLAFPRGRHHSRFGSSGRLHSVARAGRWTLTIDDVTRRRYVIEAALSSLRRPLRPCRVSFSGRALSQREWSFDRDRKVLEARVTGRGGRLLVKACR